MLWFACWWVLSAALLIVAAGPLLLLILNKIRLVLRFIAVDTVNTFCGDLLSCDLSSFVLSCDVEDGVEIKIGDWLPEDLLPHVLIFETVQKSVTEKAIKELIDLEWERKFLLKTT